METLKQTNPIKEIPGDKDIHELLAETIVDYINNKYGEKILKTNQK